MDFGVGFGFFSSLQIGDIGKMGKKSGSNKNVTLKQKVIVLQNQPFPVPSMLFGNTQTSSWFLFS